MSYLLNTLTKKREVDSIIKDTIDKVLVLRFGRASDSVCLLLDDVVRPPLLPSLLRLSKSAREVSKFATIALVDIDSEDVQVYVNYFDITLIPSTIFFFNAHHMKMDSGYYFFFFFFIFFILRTADHTKWVGAFHQKQDFIDVVEAIFRGAMKGKLIVNCPLPPERIPKYHLLGVSIRHLLLEQVVLRRSPMAFQGMKTLRGTLILNYEVKVKLEGDSPAYKASA
ncbi:hypothetical protein FEM48_Zijuj09G0072400 [Ziziphus jujuba var. spinosa]|uniref:Thioredoxin-like protein 4B n=1 Tax=Ziziphus jujuba var. spinosa TaxID=714518 RepID=A0A978URK9_ZIZJJ|nr:hypothetical protein FEM48_Zijuj09G0072400 [Ziziphus jujuba var. spinosa]